MHRPQNKPDNLLPSIFLMLVVLLLFAIAGLHEFWEFAKNTIGQTIGTLFAGSAAILGGFLAYTAAKLKVEQEERHREEDIQNIRRARATQTIRVCESILRRINSFTIAFRDERIDLPSLKMIAAYNEFGPTGGLINLLENGQESDPEVLNLLHQIYSLLDHAKRTISHIEEYKDMFPAPWREGDTWCHEALQAIDASVCRVYKVTTATHEKCINKLGNAFQIDDPMIDKIAQEKSKRKHLLAPLPLKAQKERNN